MFSLDRTSFTLSEEHHAIVTQEQLTLLMAPEARKSDVSQDEYLPEQAVRSGCRERVTFKIFRVLGLNTQHRLLASAHFFQVWSIVWFDLKWSIREMRHQERCSALFDFVTNINDEDTLFGKQVLGPFPMVFATWASWAHRSMSWGRVDQWRHTMSYHLHLPRRNATLYAFAT